MEKNEEEKRDNMKNVFTTDISTKKIRLGIAKVLALVLVIQVIIPLKITYELIKIIPGLDEWPLIITYTGITFVGAFITGAMSSHIVRKELDMQLKRAILYSGEILGLIVLYVFMITILFDIKRFLLIILLRVEKFQVVFDVFNLWFILVFMVFLLGCASYYKIFMKDSEHLEILRINKLIPLKLLIPLILFSSIGVSYSYYWKYYLLIVRRLQYVLSTTYLVFSFLTGYFVLFFVFTFFIGGKDFERDKKFSLASMLFTNFSAFYLVVVLFGTLLTFYIDAEKYYIFVYDGIIYWAPLIQALLQGLFFFLGGYYLLNKEI